MYKNQVLTEKHEVDWILIAKVNSHFKKVLLTLMRFWWTGKQAGSAVMTRSDFIRIFINLKDAEDLIKECTGMKTADILTEIS